MAGQFTRFLLVGGLAAAVNLGARYLFSLYVTFEWAVALAFPFGLLTAFWLSRKLVFAASGQPIKREFGWFLTINLAALVQVWLISVGLARWLLPALNYTFYPFETAHFVGVATPMITSYLGHKYLTFRRKTP